MATKSNKPVNRGGKTGNLGKKSSTLTSLSSLNNTISTIAPRTSSKLEPKNAKKGPKSKKENDNEVDKEKHPEEDVIIPCEPCFRKSSKIESGGFCLECTENLCDDCIAYHKTLKITENHTIVDGKKHDDDSLASISLDSALASTPLKTPSVSYHTHDTEPQSRNYKFVATEKCTIHDEKLIELFCEDDAELICSVCAGTAHRRCKSVLYIPKAAEGIRKDKRCREIKEKLTELKVKFGKLIKEKQKSIWSYEQQRETALKSVTRFRESIDKLLDDLQSSMEQEIEKKFQKGKGVYENNLKQCEETLSALTKRILKLEDDIRKNDEAKIFMDLKIYNDDVKLFSSKYEEEANAKGYELKVVIDDTLKQMIKREHLMRSVTYGKPIKTGDYKIKMKINGLAMLPDGRLVVHDSEKLVLLHENFTINTHSNEYVISGAPNAICALDTNTVAMTMHKMKQVIVLNCRHDLEEKIAFNLRAKSLSNGLAGFEEKLYCLCRADNDELTSSPRTAIYVYNLTGEKQIATDFKYHFQSLAISDDGEWLAATNRYDHSISVFDKQLNIIKTHHDSLPQRKMETCVCIGIDREGLIYVLEGNTIVATALGSKCRSLLSSEDGIHSNATVIFDQQLRRFIVGHSGSDRLKIWQL